MEPWPSRLWLSWSTEWEQWTCVNEQPWAQDDWANDVPCWNYSNWFPIHCPMWCVSVLRKGLGPLCSFVVQLDSFFLTFSCINFMLNLTAIDLDEWQKTELYQMRAISIFFFLLWKQNQTKNSKHFSYKAQVGSAFALFVLLSLHCQQILAGYPLCSSHGLGHGKTQSILLAS